MNLFKIRYSFACVYVYLSTCIHVYMCVDVCLCASVCVLCVFCVCWCWVEVHNLAYLNMLFKHKLLAEDDLI